MLLESVVKATVALQGCRVVTVTGGLAAELVPELRFLPRLRRILEQYGWNW